MAGSPLPHHARLRRRFNFRADGQEENEGDQRRLRRPAGICAA